MAHQRQFTANVPLPSKLNTDGSSIAQNWKKFRRQFENYAIASRLNKEDGEFQCAVFLATVGEDAMDIFDGFHFENEGDKKNLDKVLKAFDDFCVGETHEAYESYKFHMRRQEPGETIEAFIASLRQLAKSCNFGEAQLEERLIRDQVVVGVREEAVREKFLENKNLTLAKCLEIGRAHETSRQQSQSISTGQEGSGACAQVSRLKNKFRRPKKDEQGYKEQKSEKKCSRCGKSPKHTHRDCPAKEAECHKCKKKGHYAAMCRTKKIVRLLEEEQENDFILGSITTEENKSSSIGNIQEDLWHAKVVTNGKPITYRVDTGADVTVLPEKFFKKNSPLVKKTDKKLYGPGENQLKVVGVVHTTLSTENTSAEQEIFVISNLKEPLLGRPAIEALHLLERVNEVKQKKEIQKENEFQKEFPELFTGLGKMKTKYKINLKENAKPFSVTAPRRLALPIRGKVETELKKMEEDDIIRPVREPTDWCAPIVTVPKANGKIRICVDYTKLNDSVRRENFPLPTTDHLLAQLSGATVFSKLDCNSGFFQIPLDEESQLMTTFITPFGRYCFKRLPFGISSGPEVFQREMSHMLAGIPGVVCDIDDVLISGRDKEEHDSRLRIVLQRMKEAGATLNEKCVFSVKKIKFLGHIISENGIEIDPEKVEAITNLPRPQNVAELRRLLGMVNHVGKFIPNLAEITKPLRDLLKEEISWTWDSHQETAFQSIKKHLTQAPVLIHYNSEKPTKVSADASSYGMGGVLLQKEGEDWKPVFYASRSLTNTEQRYAQVEKEALAVTWCCEKFADFLVGLPSFTIETDHKPLLALLKTKHLDELTPRIQRFRMRLMRFSYNVVHVAGKNLVTADTLSRAPVSGLAEQDCLMEFETQLSVKAVLESFPATERRLQEIKEKQDKDVVCSQVKQFCKSQWPDRAKKDAILKPYWTVRDDLIVEDGLLLFQTRIVIPNELQEDILQRLHEGHQGIVKCRALARSCVWWPGLSKQIEKKISNCPICEKERVLHPEPLQPTKTPDYPWQRVGMDLFEWKGHSYLLIVDYYSRWIEIAHLKQTTSLAVIEHIKAIFARQGIPEVVVSDNGPQFNSWDFVKFAKSYCFTHVKISPLHPQENGEAERAVQTIKMLLKKSDDPYIALLNYRSTPLQQGSSPAELLMGRKLRNRIPTVTKCHIPEERNLKKFQDVDAQIKQRQKEDFDKRHMARPLPELKTGQPVWVKTPKDTEAIVVCPSPSAPTSLPQNATRSYTVKTNRGIQKRNRHQLRRRSDERLTTKQQNPDATSTLPDQYENQQTDEEQPTVDQAEIPQHPRFPNGKNTQSETKLITRSGRQVKCPRKLNL